MPDPTLPALTGAAQALSKPVCKLVDAIRDGAGVLYEPTKIRKKALADADATLIYTQAEIDRDDLVRRAAFRVAAQETRRQQNIESIVGGAIKILPEEVSAEPTDPDWVAGFFDSCKDVSNEELQDLWAKLLSQEVAAPGRCHPSTLSSLATLTANDARLFAQLASFAVGTPGGGVKVPVEPFDAATRVADYGGALHLSGLGLIQLHSSVYSTFGSDSVLEYDGRGFIRRDREVEFQSYPLSRAGIDLYAVVQPEYLPEIETWLVDHLGMQEIAIPPEVRLLTVAGSPRHPELPSEDQDE